MSDRLLRQLKGATVYHGATCGDSVSDEMIVLFNHGGDLEALLAAGLIEEVIEEVPFGDSEAPSSSHAGPPTPTPKPKPMPKPMPTPTPTPSTTNNYHGATCSDHGSDDMIVVFDNGGDLEALLAAGLIEEAPIGDSDSDSSSHWATYTPMPTPSTPKGDK